MLLVDDAQKAKKDELALLAECVQYEIRKRHDMALVPAGTRESMLACADGAGMGSLSRAKAEDLRVIPEDESAPALEEALLAEEVLLEDAFLPFATCFAACVPSLFSSAIASPSRLSCVTPS